MLVALLGIVTYDVWGWGHPGLTVRTSTPPLYFANGSPRDTSNSYIVFVKHDDEDSTYIHPDLMFNTIQRTDTLGVWNYDNLAPWSYFMIDTIGPDSVIAYPMFIYPTAKVIGDTAIVAATAFASEIVPTTALEDSAVTGVKVLSRALASKHVAYSTLVGGNLATGAVSLAAKIAAGIVGPDQTNLAADWAWTGQHSFADTIFVTATKRREVVFAPLHTSFSVDGIGVGASVFWDETGATSGAGDVLIDKNGVDTNIPCVLLATADIINFDWYIPAEFDTSADLEFYLVYSVANVTFDDWEVKFDLSYRQYGYGESATQITSTMLTTGVTDAADYIFDDTSTFDYRRMEHGPFVIAGGTLPATAPGTDMTVKLVLTLTGTSFTFVQLVHVDAVYNLTRL